MTEIEIIVAVTRAGTSVDATAGDFHSPVTRVGTGTGVPGLAAGYQIRPADAVAKQIAADAPAVVPPRVLTGPSGVGKNQAAAYDACRARAAGQLDLLVRVAASSRAGVPAVYAQVAAEVMGYEDTEAEWRAEKPLGSWTAKTHPAQAPPAA